MPTPFRPRLLCLAATLVFVASVATIAQHDTGGGMMGGMGGNPNMMGRMMQMRGEMMMKMGEVMLKYGKQMQDDDRK